MKFRLTAPFLTFIVALYFTAGISLADSLSLTKIGSFDTAGKVYSEWWYTGINPTFYGTADIADDVIMKIGDNTYEASANTEGDWDITVALAVGNYNISITSGTASYDFTLHLGQDYTGTTTQTSSSTSAVPATGAEQTIALTLGLGVSLLALYLYFFDTNKKHKAFEKNVVSDK